MMGLDLPGAFTVFSICIYWLKFHVHSAIAILLLGNPDIAGYNNIHLNAMYAMSKILCFSCRAVKF